MPKSPTVSEGSCLSYEERWVAIYFPEGEVACKYCPLMETYARKQCRKTGEYLVSDNTTGYWCPLLSTKDETIINPETGELIKIN